MNLYYPCIAVCFLSIALNLSVTFGQDPKPDLEVKKALSDLRSDDSDLQKLTTTELFGKAEWVLDEFQKWQIKNPDFDKIELEAAVNASAEEPDDPFSGFGFADSSGDDEAVEQYDFTSALDEILEILLFRDEKAILPGFRRLATKYEKTRKNSYFLKDSFQNYIIAASLLDSLSRAPYFGKGTLDPTSDSLPAVPKFLKGADEELLAAWRDGEFVKSIAIPDAAVDTISYHSEADQFADIIEDSLLNGDWSNAAKIDQYIWGHFCGVGSEVFQWPKLNFTAVNRVRQKRAGEAYGQLISYWVLIGGDYLISVNFDLEKYRERVLVKISEKGVNWENVAGGIILSQGWFPWGADRLGKVGGNKTAQLMVKASRLPELEPQTLDTVFEILTQIIDRHYYGDRSSVAADPFSDEKKLSDQPILDDETLNHSLEAIARMIPLANEASAQRRAINLLGNLNRYKSTLIDLISHPVPSVSKAAEDILTNKGLIDEIKSKQLTRVEKYQFRFTVGDKLLNGYWVGIEHSIVSLSGTGRTVFGGGNTKLLNDEGGFSFHRPDQSHISDERGFLCVYPSNSDKHYTPIKIETSTPLFWFAENYVELKRRKSNDIVIPAHKLTVNIDKPGIATNPVTVAINLQPSVSSPHLGSSEFLLEATDSVIALPYAGEGKYSISAWGNGLTISEAIEFTINGNQTVNVKLEKGYQLKFHLTDEIKRSHWVDLKKRIVDPNETWESIIEADHYPNRSYWDHLPVGSYKLEILPFSDKSLRYKEIPFEINPDSPPVIDLGELAP